MNSWTLAKEYIEFKGQEDTWTIGFGWTSKSVFVCVLNK